VFLAHYMYVLLIVFKVLSSFLVFLSHFRSGVALDER